MKTYLDCIPCFMEQALRAGRIAKMDDSGIKKLLDEVGLMIKDVPVKNDVTMREAIDSGLDKVAKLVSSGSSAPAIIPDRCSGEFLDLFENADMIISKGQGNYEGLSGSDRPVFFLLKAKCQILAKDLGVEKGDIVLASSNKRTPA